MNPMIRVTALRTPVISVIWLPPGVSTSPVARSRNRISVLGTDRNPSAVQAGMKRAMSTMAKRLRRCSVSA